MPHSVRYPLIPGHKVVFVPSSWEGSDRVCVCWGGWKGTSAMA